MSIALLVMTDGRDDYLRRCLASLDNVHGPITEMWMHDDTGDYLQRAALSVRHPAFIQLGHGARRGFGGAISYAWSQLAARSAARWVFHVEQDFVFTRPVDLAEMAAALDATPTLVQMALRRQPWAPDEHAAGGVVELHPDAYADHDHDGNPYLRHRLFFTTNPSLYHRSLTTCTWPTGPNSEGRFTHRLLRDGMGPVEGPHIGFAYWGSRTDPPWVEHIGARRVGVDY
jgi:hypothetical protein